MQPSKSFGQKSSLQSSTPSQPSLKPGDATQPMRWSDVAAGRRTTHPDAAPIKPVLDTAELLEGILQHLPVQDLILAQRICRTVRNNIINSPLLQTKLLMRPDPNSKRRTWLVDYVTREVWTGARAESHVEQADSIARAVEPVIHNSLLFSTRSEDDHGLMLYKFRAHSISTSISLRSCVREKLNLKTLFAQPSCRKMLLSSPPVKEVDMSFSGRCQYLPWEDRRGLPKWFEDTVARRTIVNESGVTFGEVMDVYRSEMRRHDHCALEGIYFVDGFAVSHEQMEAIESIAKSD